MISVMPLLASSPFCEDVLQPLQVKCSWWMVVHWTYLLSFNEVSMPLMKNNATKTNCNVVGNENSDDIIALANPMIWQCSGYHPVLWHFSIRRLPKSCSNLGWKFCASKPLFNGVKSLIVLHS